MTTIVVLLILMVYFLGIFSIGLPMGRKSLEVWEKVEGWPAPNCAKDEAWMVFLFPFTMIIKGLEKQTFYDAPLGIVLHRDADANPEGYVAMTAILWPFRLTYILGILITALVIGITVFSWCFMVYGLPKYFSQFLKEEVEPDRVNGHSESSLGEDIGSHMPPDVPLGRT